MSNSPLILRLKQLPHGLGLPLPTYATPGAAGMDLRAAVTEQIQLAGGQRALIPTGLALELPVGYEGQIRPRSGLAIRHGLTVLNAPGTIDSDYRGEVQVILINLGLEAVTISRGDRIAQLVIAPCCTVQLEETAELADSNRGTGGFGHTGPN